MTTLKNKIILGLYVLILFSSEAVIGQIVTDKTNDILINFREADKNTSMPVIEWVYPRIEYTNSTEKLIQLRAKVTSNVPLKNVELTIKRGLDGDLIGTRAVELDDPFNVDIDLNLNVIDGENWIELIAENETGGKVKDHRSIKVGMDAIGNAVTIDRKDYALLFGTNRYDHWNDLVNPVFDAETIARELQERYGFIVEIVKDAEQDVVMTKLREYAQRKYKPQDQLFIFFAGHGVYDEVFGEGFLVAKNSIINDVSKNTYISHNRIRSNINNIPCDHIFLVMDTCFGGTFDPVLASSRSALYEDVDDKEYLVKKLSKRTRKYLTY